MDLSFSGAGFMGCYYFGVVNCWNKYIPRDRVRRVAGASAGSLIAAYYLMDLPLDACLKTIIDMTEDIRRRPLGVFDRSNQIVDILPRDLDRMFPDDAHKRVSGRLFVCMTRLKDMKSVIVNEFETKKDLIDALNCSCFIPVWSGNHVSTYKGVKHIDGGFTNNLPVFDEHTIRVCCFSGASDIAPFDRSQGEFRSVCLMGMPLMLNWKNLRRGRRALWPPPPSYIIELLERGFHDAKNFILSNDLIQCNSCFKSTEPQLQPIYSKLTPTISPAASPAISRAGSHMNLADLTRSASFRRRKEAARETEATIRQLEQMLEANKAGDAPPSLFGRRRSKSGKQITLEALARLPQQAGEAEEAKASKSFARRLRDKFARSSPSKKPTGSDGAKSSCGSSERGVDSGEEGRSQTASASLVMPTIVVDEEQRAAADDDEDAGRATASPAPAAERESAAELASLSSALGSRPSSSSSSASPSPSSGASESGDSAVGGLRSSGTGKPVAAPANTTRRMSNQSPSDKFLASRKMSLAASKAELQEQQELNGTNSLLPDRFAFAPSQLPSCPPSPNLNRHCGECIRLRQQARLDEIDPAIKLEAERYGSMESKDPEKEFGSLRQRLFGWFRGQFGAAKYSYELNEDELEAELVRPALAQRRASEIPTS